MKKGSLFFAPMEGITNEAYRKTVVAECNEWDYLSCDFLRVPSVGIYPMKHLIKHFGSSFLQDEEWRKKTLFQILTSQNAKTKEIAQRLTDMQVPWVDLNLGCPSNTVCGSGGGSFLLKDLTILEKIVKDIRNNFPGKFSCKVRLGFSSPDGFDDLIKLLNDSGVEMITVHGRTRAQLYKEPANWHYIGRAVELSQVPIIGNGDLWNAHDIKRMFKQTGCHGVMVARGAMKAPWVAELFKSGHFDESSSQTLRRVKSFLLLYRKNLLDFGVTPDGLLKQSKSVSRFMFENIQNGEQIRRGLLLSQNSDHFYQLIENLI